MNCKRPNLVTLMAMTLALGACGGGGSTASVPDDGITLAERVEAATATVASNARCSASTLGAYYWEIGNASGVLASGRVGVNPPAAGTQMRVYSASKWLYAASVLQRHADFAGDVKYLNFTSGYTEFGNVPVCVGDTVGDCLIGRDGYDAADDGRFAYDSGHMQVHAADVMGFGGYDNGDLANALNSALGNLGLAYWVQQPAAGVLATPSAYGAFLRRLLDGTLRLGGQLGAYKVCAQSGAPGCNAAETPDSIGTERWNYALGHWVEDDPVVGDHAFSSAGGGGFYPWIDAGRAYYGILARETETESAAGYRSAECGRLVRQAWLTGRVVTATAPTP
jgi:hypothetical protein